MIKLNKAYVYDPVTREFVGVARLDHDPLSGGWLMPANAVQVKPDVANCPDNKTLVLSDDGAKWVAVEDYRGEVIYRVADGHPAQVNGLGTLSADVTLIKPEPEEGFLIDQFDEKSKKWLYRKNFAGMVVYSTDDGAPRTLTIDDRAIPDGYTDKSRQNDAYNWDAKSSDWVLDKAKQAELDAAAKQQAVVNAVNDVKHALQAHIDAVAAGLGFSGGNAVMLYTGFNNPFRALAEAFGAWEAGIWVLANEQMALVKAGKQAMPTLTEATGMIPEFVPPSAN